ncbi:uncharacterized protein LOC131604830 [Vicia villosa]|uniref:uncharacterized protein LOC131604830 n=1 Tax=Vicia villosa TaxID=3911 RepID=UPI00273C4B04|nr:uncharacterized protein LOC131604830 [Vicia villosa]
MKGRRRHNHIGSIVTSSGIVDSVAEVKEEVLNHFASKFVESDEVRPILEGINFKKISHAERFSLEAPFTEGEIREAVWALIPKSSNPLGLDDYRPIYLVGCIYKAISKLLASRLKLVLNSIVSQCQSAFVSGRQLLDGVVVANELMDFAKREGNECLLFKVHAQEHGFRGGVDVMDGDVDLSIRMSVLVSGSPTKEFRMGRGLRQGPPLPFLFVLVVEGLRGVGE